MDECLGSEASPFSDYARVLQKKQKNHLKISARLEKAYDRYRLYLPQTRHSLR